MAKVLDEIIIRRDTFKKKTKSDITTIHYGKYAHKKLSL